MPLSDEECDELLVTLRHARVFIVSREKMHPVGVRLYDEQIETLKRAGAERAATVVPEMVTVEVDGRKFTRPLYASPVTPAAMPDEKPDASVAAIERHNNCSRTECRYPNCGCPVLAPRIGVRQGEVVEDFDSYVHPLNVVDQVEALPTALHCGHPRSLLVRSVESDYSFCELCDTRSRLHDAELMENELRLEVVRLKDELRAALPTARAEPVAWRMGDFDDDGRRIWRHSSKSKDGWEPLYAAPQVARQEPVTLLKAVAEVLDAHDEMHVERQIEAIKVLRAAAAPLLQAAPGEPKNG